MKYSILILALILTPALASSQSVWKKKKQKVSHAQGTLYGSWGYNRSAYTKSNMRFVGPGYDFTLAGAKAHDNPSPLSSGYYWKINHFSVPQFNARLGYYFRHHWAISFGYDHMKYIFQDKNEVILSGEIDPGVDNVTNWSGLYGGEEIVTDRNTFHYENSDGLNYLRFELMRTDMLIALGRDNQFVVSSNLSVGAGSLLSFNDFDFAGTKTMRTISMSGYGLSAHASLRFEFFRHVFIQTKFGGGLNHQVKVRTRPNDPSSFARHAYGYGSFDTSIGFLLYIRPTNACDSCPVWN